MSSNPVTISVNLKIKDNEITLSMEEAREIYLQLKAILGYTEPHPFPCTWVAGYPNPYIKYSISYCEGANCNWKTPS